jgi:hypothetical protein
MAVNLLLGWDWFPSSTQAAERLDCSASANAATGTCEHCSSMVRGLYSAVLPEKPMREASGSDVCGNGGTQTWLLLR